MAKPKKIAEILKPEVVVNPMTDIVEVVEPTKDIPEVVHCMASHPQLPYPKYERKFLNRADAEAWMKRFNGVEIK